MLDGLVVVVGDEAQALEEQVDSWALQGLVGIGSDVRSVNYPSELDEGGIGKVVELEDGLERAGVALVSPRNTWHVKGNRACGWWGVKALDKDELGIGVDEASNQPGGSTAIHMDILAGTVEHEANTPPSAPQAAAEAPQDGLQWQRLRPNRSALLS